MMKKNILGEKMPLLAIEWDRDEFILVRVTTETVGENTGQTRGRTIEINFCEGILDEAEIY